MVSSALLAAVGISRAQRLKHRSEFDAVYKGGRVFRNDYLIIRALRTDASVTRFGFAAGKALGGAVVRNRVKRRLRVIVGSVAVEPGWDIVLNARSNSTKASYEHLSGSVATLMGRAGVLR